MADLKQRVRQLKIQTGSCRRLTSDFKMYLGEKDEYSKKLKSLTESKGDKYAIKKQMNLLEEVCAVIISIHGKVKDAYAKLDGMVCAAKADSELAETEEVEKAAAQLIKTHDLLNAKKKKKSTDPKADEKGRIVSVFGSSRAQPEDPSYMVALNLGEALAKQGFKIMNGGYAGLMEAVSKGAAKVNGASIRGVLVPTVFPNRKGGNQYLTEKPEAASIEMRLAMLVGDAGAYVVLPGSIGTLTELIMAWNSAVLAPVSGNKAPPVIAFRDPWEDVLQGIQKTLSIPKQFLDAVQFVSSVEEAMKLLSK